MAQFSPPLTVAEVQACFPGRFTKVAAIFAGGQGAVFRGDTSAGAEAVKLYVPEPGARLDERTQREVAALQQLSCDTIVRVKDHGTVIVRGTPCRFVITAFIEGSSLQDLIAKGPVTVTAAAQIGYDIAEAIDAMWNSPARIVHRDIKPPNVMATLDGRAIVIDLGIARHTTLDTLTTPGVAWGTRGYMSPEQAEGRKNLTCRSDIFSLGVVLYVSLTCQHPTGHDQLQLMKGCSSLGLANQNLPAELTTLVDQMLLPKTAPRPMPDRIRAVLKPLLTKNPW